MRKLAFSLLLGCAACSGGAQSPRTAATAPAVPPKAPAPSGPSATLDQIRAQIGTAACTDTSQCHSLPIGARACGGPQGYLAWSSAHTSGEALRALGERFQAEQQAGNAASGAMSDCRFMADPGAVCRAGTCQPGAGGPAVR